ncbi:MAG: radical SAM protein [Puniceicoccales bacterium]|jgi:radical SAM superfamily enzyme YgiQ (UPF0313 family)|nr:radical SAM protein [Puniceicoccales bacterium]
MKPIYQIIRKISFNEEIENDKVQLTPCNNGYIARNAGPFKGQVPIADYSSINREGYIYQQKVLYKLDYSNITYQLLVGDRCCPYSCSFCRISKNTESIKEASQVANEMIALHRQYGCRNFSLICNEMNPSRSYAAEFVDTLLSYDNHLNWFCYLRPNNLSADELLAIKKAGCVLIRFGVESGSQRILDSMNKKLYVSEIEQILADSHKAGIWNHINIMTGYLYESQDDINETISFLRKNRGYIDSIRVNPFFIPIGSPIHLNPQEFNIEIVEETSSHIVFHQRDISWEEKKKQISHATSQVLAECKRLGIGYAGILPNLVCTSLCHFGQKEQGKIWLRENHNYLWEPVSPDTAKWKLAHPENPSVEINPWEKIYGQRGENYQTRIDHEIHSNP